MNMNLRRLTDLHLIIFLITLVVSRDGFADSATLSVGFYPIQPPVDGSVTLAGSSATGRIAAGIVTTANTRSLFLWNPLAGSHVVPLPTDSKIWQVSDISADGSTVVGQISNGVFGTRQAFRWTEIGGFETLGTLSNDRFDESHSNRVNSDGSIVVGYSDTPNGYRGFRWTQATGMVNLGTLGTSNSIYPPWSMANDLSDDGKTIVGYTNVVGKNQVQMARWTFADGWQVFGSLPEPPRSASASSMSADGSIVVGGNQGAGFDGIIWTQEAGLRALPRLDGFGYHSAVQVSDDGSLITGNVIDIPLTMGQAVAWTKAGDEYRPELLTDLMADRGLDLGGWTIWSVNSMSRDGRVLAGTAFDTQGRTRGYVAVLPVPEPTALGLLVLCLTALCLDRSSLRCRR